MDKDNTDLRKAALECQQITDPQTKVEQTQLLYKRWLSGEMTISNETLNVPDTAGRPDKPELVAPKDLPRRRNSKESGVASLLHAVVHIEFNAINLGWDAVARFSDMPEQFYDDWARVAFEESQHFVLLRDHLLTLGYDYGDFPAHSGMWDMAKKPMVMY